jgi:polyisoprenyl-phosphate glycosyltransferase
MLKLMDQGADVVYGQRQRRAGESGFKLMTAKLFYRVLERMTDVAIPRDTGDFRLMSRRALNALLAMPERHRFIRGMVSWIGFNQVPLLYNRGARFAGETKYPLRKMWRLAVDAVTGFSTRPLRFANLAGFLTSLLALGLVVFSIVSYFQGKTIVGWTSVIAVVAFLSGIQMFVLGILGEYIGRLYEESKGRPLFLIDGLKYPLSHLEAELGQFDNGRNGRISDIVAIPAQPVEPRVSAFALLLLVVLLPLDDLARACRLAIQEGRGICGHQDGSGAIETEEVESRKLRSAA